jgi:hypothetical protein
MSKSATPSIDIITQQTFVALYLGHPERNGQCLTQPTKINAWTIRYDPPRILNAERIDFPTYYNGRGSELYLALLNEEGEILTTVREKYQSAPSKNSNYINPGNLCLYL